MSAQPFRLGWNPDVKAKQEEVRWQLVLHILHVSLIYMDISVKITYFKVPYNSEADFIGE